jgi:hypothetical protein
LPIDKHGRYSASIFHIFVAMLRNLAIIILLTNLLFSCKLEQCDDPVPFVEFKDFIQSGDSAEMILHFRDCDGDFGLEDVDGVPQAPYDYNLFMDYYYYKDTKWIKFQPADSFEAPFFYRVPEIENRSVSKTLEGEIHVQMYPYFIPPYDDTIRYEIYIRDRALNESNRIVTPSIIIR